MSQTAEPVAEPATGQITARRATVPERIQHVLHGRPALSPLIVLILAFVFFGLVADRFFSPANVSLLLQQTSIVGSLAVGQTLIILTAGIDLSIGAVMVLSSLVMSKLALEHNVPGPVALLIGLGVALAAEALNGFLVTKIRLPPFIVTLGTLSIFTALALIYARGQTISLPGGLLVWTNQLHRLGGYSITNGVILMILLYLVIGFALRFTAWGRHLYAVGDDAEGSGLAGVKVDRSVLGAYVVAGLAVLIAAWVFMGRVGGADPNGAINLNLNSITAVVIGGTSLFGGRGALTGTLIGALIVQVFQTGLNLSGVDPNYQVLAVGILVIVAVSVDQWIRKVRG